MSARLGFNDQDGKHTEKKIQMHYGREESSTCLDYSGIWTMTLEPLAFKVENPIITLDTAALDDTTVIKTTHVGFAGELRFDDETLLDDALYSI